MPKYRHQSSMNLYNFNTTSTVTEIDMTHKILFIYQKIFTHCQRWNTYNNFSNRWRWMTTMLTTNVLTAIYMAPPPFSASFPIHPMIPRRSTKIYQFNSCTSLILFLLWTNPVTHLLYYLRNCLLNVPEFPPLISVLVKSNPDHKICCHKNPSDQQITPSW